MFTLMQNLCSILLIQVKKLNDLSKTNKKYREHQKLTRI